MRTKAYLGLLVLVAIALSAAIAAAQSSTGASLSGTQWKGIYASGTTSNTPATLSIRSQNGALTGTLTYDGFEETVAITANGPLKLRIKGVSGRDTRGGRNFYLDNFSAELSADGRSMNATGGDTNSVVANQWLKLQRSDSTPAVAQHPASQPGSPSQARTFAAGSGLSPRPFDYFDAGQFMEFSNNINNLKNFSPDGIRAEFVSGRQLFVNASATPQVLASYDSIVKTDLALPLFRNYSSWTQAQQDAWNKSEVDSRALDQWLGTNLDTKASFFFWLGNKTALLGKTVASQFDWGNDLETAQGLAKPGLQKFTQLANSPAIFQTLQAPVQAAVKAIASYNGKANNLSRLDISAIQKQASVILLHASNHTLTK
jgi:hypothetical protein